ncbi:MAG: SUMF1/EgtB/PvdO family nonheme iron enzyme [Chitinispirillaceae bacterium]|nr:SUMF1/EgtB/PvdO family nonheme iron enzyme [Chitinispirillaceae bacterium]
MDRRPALPTISFFRPTLLLPVLLLSTALIAGPADTHIEDLKAGPMVYYTPEAAAWFASFGSTSLSGLSVDKNAATRTFLATTKLGAMQLSEVREAIPVLIDVFPKAVHVVEIRQANYAGKGSFDDCVSTYVMSAKNQFMMACPFLDYNSLSACDQFLEGSHETEMIRKRSGGKGAIAEALFNLRITFTFYAGECALSRLTGMNLGHDPGAWRQWWQSSTTAPFTAASPYSYVASSPTATLVAKNSYDDIVAGGKYRVILTTGDDLTGTVESRDDSSMVLETSGGKPYAFKFRLMQSYQVIELPAPKPDTVKTAVIEGAKIITYDQLKKRAAGKPELEVKIASGRVFKGKLRTIDEEGISMDIEGSTVPIAKNIIKQIVFIPFGMAQKAGQKEQAPEKPKGPFDTLFVKNPQTDNYGKPRPDVIYTGTIISEGDKHVTLKPIGKSAPQKFSREEITRVIRHSADKRDDAIEKYAKPLTCPADMFLVDMPPGRAGKPFFKVCMDKYEYPNKSGSVPRTKLSYGEAKKVCEQQGKRLCTTVEWQWACGGQDGLAYPYGNNFEQDRCNTDTRFIESAGNRINCVSPFGGFDMSGNLFEWVTTKGGGMALMGGPVSKCQTIAEAGGPDAKPFSGVRCCKGN